MGAKKVFLILTLPLLVAFLVVLLIIRVRRQNSNLMLRKTPLSEVGSLRKPAVAGSFYPAEKEELTKLTESLLGQAEKISAEGRLKILVVPHAGLVYSGRTAAWGFKQLEGQNYSHVFILGASHRTWFDYAAVFSQGTWETPLGKVAIDEDLAKALLDEEKKIKADIAPHLEEHSLEVELVFLQKVLQDFRFVPILLGQVSEDVLNNLAQKISDGLDEKTLLVVSSDLSHYPSWQIANSVDNETIEAILSGDSQTFEEKLRLMELKNYPNLDTCACGNQAISAALKVAKILSINDFKKIKYENSGDLMVDKSRVVGYAAIGAWQKEKEGEGFLNEEAKKEALKIARQTLESYLGQGRIPEVVLKSKSLSKTQGAFVTLRKKEELRGCIGRFEPDEPLYKVIQEMAVAAATQDTRFLPVTFSELKEIKIEISVMTPKRKIGSWQEIELGRQGVVVQKGLRSGTFLPQVATETGWTKEEFLAQLCSQKAGLPPNCYRDPSVNLFVFEAQVFEEE